jgi:hypothetical protein
VDPGALTHIITCMPLSRLSKATFVGGLALALAGASFAACSGTPTAPSTSSATAQVATASPTARPSGPQPIREGLADPGTWMTTEFQPTLTFTVTSQWMFFFRDDNDEMAMGKSGDIELTASRVSSVIDPTSHAGIPAPDDLVAWLASHPALDTGAPQAATIAGIEGQSIEVTAKGDSDVDVFEFATGNLRVSAGARARITVLPYDGPDLVFCAFAPKGSFESALPEIQAVIDTVEIRPS